MVPIGVLLGVFTQGPGHVESKAILVFAARNHNLSESPICQEPYVTFGSYPNPRPSNPEPLNLNL